jgi:hypothetical protein
MISTPIASKVHCSINGLEKSSLLTKLDFSKKKLSLLLLNDNSEESVMHKKYENIE